MMKTSITPLPTGDVLVYKFGCRLDADCLPTVNEQIMLSRRLYNDLVADMRKAVEAREQRTLDLAGPPAIAIKDKIEELNAAFATARAANDETAMKAIAQERRGHWTSMSAVLKDVQAAHKQVLRSFLSSIGKNSECSTYQLRSRYVAEGLGWATANQVLDSALQAFQSTIKKGQAPRFAIGSEITRDTLSLQFTTAGGISASKLLAGEHNELKLTPPDKGYGRRCYGSFSMRMGAAKADRWANGTWQAHRAIPDGAHVAAATLVREKVGTKFTWNIQLVLKLRSPMTAPVAAEREPLAVVHLGWSADSSGRRIGAIANDADPGFAKLIQLPTDIESRLQRSADIQSQRDTARDNLVPALKAFSDGVVGLWPEPLQEEFLKIKRLPFNHIAASRLHRLWWQLHVGDLVTPAVDPLTAWRAADRLAQQACVGLARSARGARKDFYRNLALRQCQQFEAIVLDQPDLVEAAQKIDEVSGERNELGRKARSGRVVAALFEYTNALKWAAARCSTTLIEVDGDSANVCSCCGNIGMQTVDGTQFQQQQCPACTAVVDRKRNAAASVFQRMAAGIQSEVLKAAEKRVETAQTALVKQRERLAKVQESRRRRLAEKETGPANLE